MECGIGLGIGVIGRVWGFWGSCAEEKARESPAEKEEFGVPALDLVVESSASSKLRREI